MTLQVESPTVYTSQGVPISVTGIAQVKIQGQNEDMLLVLKCFLALRNCLSNYNVIRLDCLRTIFGQIGVGDPTHCACHP